MSSKIQLTRNAIMYISVGFTQPCLLQILSLRQVPDSALEMVVYDGTVYAGALFSKHKSSRLQKTNQVEVDKSIQRVTSGQEQQREDFFPRQLDVVWVRAILVGKNQPMEISQLRIIHTGLSEILGKEILDLQEYMRRRRFSSYLLVESDEEPQDTKRKQPKRNEQEKEVSTYPTNQSQKGSQALEKDNKEQQQISFEEEKEGFKDEVYSKINVPNIQPANSEVNRLLLTIPTQEAQLQDTGLSKKKRLAQKVSNQEVKPIGNRLIQEVPNPEDRAPFSNSDPGQKKHNQYTRVSEEVKKQRIQIIMDEDSEVTEIKPTKFHKSRIIDLLEENDPATQKSKVDRSTKETHLMIADLYERMHRFSILCRINSITHFRSQKGNQCTKLMLIDKQGDEIQCLLFEKSYEKYSHNGLELMKGRAYVFENGQVDKDDSGCLSISVPWSGIKQTKNVLQSFNPLKMRRVVQIQSIQSRHFLERAVEGSNKSINNRKAYAQEIHVCGILNRVKDQAKLVNNQFRVVGLLCDPQNQKCIAFALYVEQLVSFPLSGAVISLHNMRVAQYQGTFRLQSTKRSYYLVENNNGHQYYADLQEASLKGTWKLRDYKNISQVTYVPRNIAALKQLLQNMIEKTLCYSQIDCNIANIFEKKEFTACSICHHQTKPPKGLQIYCYYCKRIQKWNKRFVFIAQIADSTGSLDVAIYSSEAQVFINSAVEEYANMSREERKTLLELCSFQNLLLKIKSEKVVGGSGHSVFKAEKMTHRRALQHIKEQTIQSKTKYVPAW